MSGLGQTDPFQKQASVQESSGPLLASEPIRIGHKLYLACFLGKIPFSVSDAKLPLERVRLDYGITIYVTTINRHFGFSSGLPKKVSKSMENSDP